MEWFAALERRRPVRDGKGPLMSVRVAQMPKTAKSVQGGWASRPRSNAHAHSRLCVPLRTHTRRVPVRQSQANPMPARLRPSHAPHRVTLFGLGLRLGLRSDQPLWRSPSGGLFSVFCPTEGKENLSWSLWSRCQWVRASSCDCAGKCQGSSRNRFLDGCARSVSCDAGVRLRAGGGWGAHGHG